MKIESHIDLAGHIQGKRILHCNSLGKESVLTLAWLSQFAENLEIISVYFEFQAEHPDDKSYLLYLRECFPKVNFILEPHTIELSHVLLGDFQSPIEVLKEYNHYEFEEFDHRIQMEDIRKEYACDYICVGESKYENFARSVKFYQQGLLNEKTKKIYPLGLMTKDQVYGLLRSSGIRLHPCYKLSAHTLDSPSYYRMRSSLIAYEKYRQKVKAVYPLLDLDRYRWEILLNAKS